MATQRILNIKDELDNDPDTLGYAGMDDITAADAMNINLRQRGKNSVTADEIRGVTIFTEYMALANSQKEEWRWLTIGGDVALTGFDIDMLKSMFAIGTTTRDNLTALSQEMVTVGVAIDAGEVLKRDITEARSL
jgi:arginase family enzyme